LKTRIFKPALQALFVLMLIASEASVFFQPYKVDAAPIVEGNTVRISLNDAYIEATPATLTSSGWVDVTFWTRYYDGAVDVVYGFNGLDNVKAINPQVWESHIETKTRQAVVTKTEEFIPDKVISTNTLAKVPLGTDLSLNTKYVEIVRETTNIGYVTDNVTGKTPATIQYTQKLAYDSYDSKTGAYSIKSTSLGVEEYTEVVTDYNERPQPVVNTLSYAGANKWDIAQYKTVVKNEVQKTRVWIDIPFGGINTVSGKYNIGIKPSSLTLQQAKDQGKLWLLDPWYNASWSYRKSMVLHLDDATQTDYQCKIIVHYQGATVDDVTGAFGTAIVHTPSASVTDFDDLRFTTSNGSTEMSYWIETKTDSTSATCWVKVPTVNGSSSDTTVYIYYGNAGAAAASTYNALIVYATGDGTITAPTTYQRVHKFLLADTGTHFVGEKAGNVEYLVVAGGGGGGFGGGGAGGFITATGFSITAASYSITVGDGGAGGGTDSPGSTGQDSIFSTITSKGGGGGNTNDKATSPVGGSGGGGGATSSVDSIGGVATPAGQGNDGGDVTAHASPYSSAGGGGAGSTGGDSSVSGVSGNGGTGVHSSITGVDVGYAGGGGGACYAGGGTDGTAQDGGGAGAVGGAGGGAGTSNTGGGGGGTRLSSAGGKGASGIVIMGYQWRNYTANEPTWSSFGAETIPSCALTGTVTTAVESNIVSGGKTIILTLTNSTWVAAGGTFDAIRDDIITGMDSAQSEAGGWDAKYKANAGTYVADVVRNDDVTVTVTMSALATYSITSNETITVTVPAAALTGGVAIIASPTFTITEGAGCMNITTQAASSVEATTATGNGDLVDDTGKTVTERGIAYCLAADGTPDLTDAHEAAVGTGEGAFTAAITGLATGTAYHFIAYSTESTTPATCYGSVVDVLTKPAAPTNVSATDGTDTAKVVITWTKSTGATDYHVWRDAVDLGAAGDVATVDDAGAGAPTITPGTATASDGTSDTVVTLSVAGETGVNGTTHTYKVVASNATGNSADSATNTGYRGTTTLTYAWQQSAGEPDAAFGAIAGGTTDPYNDTTGVAFPSWRWYYCIISMTGAANANTTHNQGYLAVAPTVTTGICSGSGTTWAVLNGNVTATGAPTTITQRGVEYGLTTAYGSLAMNTGTYSTGAYSVNLTGLTPSTVYHYRAGATNGAWGYGADAVFATKGSPAITTYLNTGDDSCMPIYGQTVAAQTFTTSATTEYSVTSIRLLLSRTLTPGTINVSIRRTAAGVPTGVDLTSGTLLGTSIDTSYTWYDITMSTKITLELNTMYAIIVSAPSGDVSNYVCWRYSATGGLANGNGLTSTDSGVSWSSSPQRLAGLGASLSSAPYDDDAWVSPTNIYVDNAVYASVTAATLDTNDYTEVLNASTFGLTIPSSATITGIKVEVDRYKGAGAAKDGVIQLTKDGTTRVGTSAATATAWPAASAIATYGGSADLWGTTWTPAEVNAATFGVHVAAQATADDTDVYVDFVRITVYYSYDYMFEIWGNQALEIQDAKVFQSYKATGDWLITVRYVNTYAPYYDTYDIKKYFTLQLIDSLGAVKASTVMPAWGNRVGSIYLSAANVSPLTYGGTYRVRIQGTFTGTPYTEYALAATDWMGDDLVNLDSWVLTSSAVIGTYYSTSMTTYIAERGECLNSTGSGIFSSGIAGLGIERPAIFQTYTAPSTYTPGTITQAGRLAIPAWQTNVGPDATVMLTRLGNIVGIGGDIIAIIAFLIMMFILMALAFPVGNTTAALVLSLPMLGGAIWFGMDLIYIGMIALVAAFLFIKNFWIDKGN
jgi:hypothetical protein